MCECTKIQMQELITENKKRIEAIKSEMPYKENLNCIDRLKTLIWTIFVFYVVLPIFRVFCSKETYKQMEYGLKESHLGEKWHIRKQKMYNEAIAYYKTSIELVENRLKNWKFESCNHQKGKDIQ